MTRSSFGNTSWGLQFRVHFSKGRGEDPSLGVVVIHVEVDGSALGLKEEWGSQLKSSVLHSLERSNQAQQESVNYFKKHTESIIAAELN